MGFGAWLAGVLTLALAGSVTAQMALEEIIVARAVAMNAEHGDAAASLHANGATYAVIFCPDEEPVFLAGKDAIDERLASFTEGARDGWDA
jgi:hypothetical protein